MRKVVRKLSISTSEQKVLANEIQRGAEKTIKKQDVEAREAILALERQEADAEAVQAREIHTTKVREQAEMDRIAAEEKQKAEEAEIAAGQEIGIAQENARREIEVAEQNRQRAVLVKKSAYRKNKNSNR